MKIVTVLIILACSCFKGFSQSSTILPGGASFDNNSNIANLKIPKLNYSQILSIQSPQVGMLVYDTDADCIRNYNGAQNKWICLSDGNNNPFEGTGGLSNTFLAYAQYSIFSYKQLSNSDYFIDSQNNNYLVGSFAGAPFNGQSCYSSNNGSPSDLQYFRPTGYLMKYDSNLSAAWCFSVNGKLLNIGGPPYTYTNFQSAITKVIVRNTDVYITGHFNNTITINGVDIVATSGYDCFLAKLNATTGQLMWLKKIVTNSSEDETDVKLSIDNSGNIYVGANFNSNITIENTVNLIHNGGGDFYIAKFDANGVLQSATGYGGANQELLGGIIATTELYVAGTFVSSTQIGSLTATGDSGKNLFITKMNTSLAPTQLTNYNTTGSFSVGLFQTSATSLLLSGKINGQATVGFTLLQDNSFIFAIGTFNLTSIAANVFNGNFGKFVVQGNNIYCLATDLRGFASFQGVIMGGGINNAIYKLENTGFNSYTFRWFKKIGDDYKFQNVPSTTATAIAVNAAGNIIVPYIYLDQANKRTSLIVTKYVE